MFNTKDILQGENLKPIPMDVDPNESLIVFDKL